MRTIKTKDDWNFFFELATDDIAGYHWALEQWNKKERSYFDIFLEMTYRRRRSLEARNVLEKNCPQVYLTHKNKLFDLINSAEEKFRDIIQEEKLFNDIFTAALERLDRIEGLLVEMYNSYSGEIIFQDRELKEDIEELGSSFLEMFLRHKYIDDQCNDFISIRNEKIKEYHKHFSEIDKKFRSYFYLFAPLKTVIDKYFQESYFPELCWWLSSPVPANSANDKLIPSLVKAGFARFANMKAFGCPEPQQLAAYAFCELEQEERMRVEDHLLTCLPCMEEVVLLRAVDETAPIPTYEEIEAMETILVPSELMERVLPSLKAGKSIKELLPQINELIDKYIMQPGKGLAEQLSDVILDAFPGQAMLAFEFIEKGVEESYRFTLPKKVWFVERKRQTKILLVGQPGQEVSDDMDALANFMDQVHFYTPLYYSLYGMGHGKMLRPILQGIEESDQLPIEIDSDKINDINTIILIASIKRETMVAIDKELAEGMKKKKLVIPSDEPDIWLFIYVD